MMAQGRGSASCGALAAAALLVIGLLVMATSAPLAEAAASYMVGDYGGWKFNVDRWAKGRTFRAGDQLGRRSRAARSICARPPPRRASLLRSSRIIIMLRDVMTYTDDLCAPAQCSTTTGRCTTWRW